MSKEKEKKAAYDAQPERRAKRAISTAKYDALPESKAKKKLQHQTPEYKTVAKLYSQLPKTKVEASLRQQMPAARVKQKLMRENPENKAKVKLQHQTPEYKAYQAEYNARPEVKVKKTISDAKYRAIPENRARRTANHNRRYASDPAYKIVLILRSRLRTAIRGKYKRGSAVKLLGCSIEELLTHLKNQFTLGMSWKNHGLFGWHIDHILPLSSFDLEDPEQLAIACHYTNLQPLWASDNLSKHDKVFIEGAK